MEGDEKIHIPEDVEREVYAEMIAYDKEQKEKWEKAKKDLEGLIHPKYFDFSESHDTYCSEGIVEMYETDEKQNGYGKSQRNCRIKGGSSSLYMYTTGEVEYFYGVEGRYEGESVEYWVNQWSIGDTGDSFAGELLFPMNDGRYWKISYSC